VLSGVAVVERPELSIRAVTCDDDHTGWSPPEVRDHHSMVLVRRGRFRRLVDGVAADLDPTVAYLGRPGEEERFAHPAGGDVCSWIAFAPGLWLSLAGDPARWSRSTVYVDARLDLAHRRLLAARDDPDFALTEELLTLLAAALRQVVADPARAAGATPGRPPTGATPSRCALVAAAREAILADHPAATGLVPLAALLGVTPWQLSRAFPRELGVSLTHYRNRVRVTHVLDRLAAGAPSLAELAADLGFADQAHLSRTMRTHLGHTPTELRRLLTPA